MTDVIELVIPARRRDIGDFEVGRVLPVAHRRLVGPFIFFDHMGPATFAPGKGLDVRPHPHIGLATVTYLFDGEIMHRDSVGSVQAIRPGDVNWMVAGNGIVHSERTAPELRAKGFKLHGIQSWVALPKAHESTAPRFDHHPAATLPTLEMKGAKLRVIAGAAYGLTSPVAVYSGTLYVDAAMDAGAIIEIPADHDERAVYVAEGAARIAGQDFAEGQMIVLKPGMAATAEALQPSRLMLVGGATLDGPRLIWWNLVASDQTLIDQAKEDWIGGAAADWRGRFTLPPNESEFIPLPSS